MLQFYFREEQSVEVSDPYPRSVKLGRSFGFPEILSGSLMLEEVPLAVT
jgi:hypothetical protein